MKKKKVVWTKEYREKVMKYLLFYKRRLFLDQWQIETNYEEKEKDSSTLAEVFCSPEYMKCSIQFYPVILKEYKLSKNDNIFKDTIKHELCHCLTEKLFKLAEQRFIRHNEISEETECLTQKIANLIQ